MYEMLIMRPKHLQDASYWCDLYHPVDGVKTVYYDSISTALNEDWEPCGFFLNTATFEEYLQFKRNVD